MEDSGTVRARNTAADGNQDADRRELITTKPLHRFVQKEPKSLGIVILILGCVEILMGFQLIDDDLVKTSNYIYIPFWQGTLFLVCGNLSIYTGIHPSKKMVTVCMAMYVVALFGIAVSFCYRSWCMAFLSYRRFATPIKNELLSVIEALLFVSSLCVSVLLIFLLAVARLALKSTRTQIIVHQIPPPATETPTN